MPGRSATFYVFCGDLQQSFEIRWHFSDTCWDATVHPMDGPSRRCNGDMAEPFGRAFQRVFGAFDGAHLIPAIPELSTGD
jgi:hypothetical protein